VGGKVLHYKQGSSEERDNRGRGWRKETQRGKRGSSRLILLGVGKKRVTWVGF